MATMNSGLGGPAGYGENVFSSTSKYSGSNDDGNVEIDITSVFSGGINFFGTTYTEIYLSGNGLITFGDPHDNDNDDGFGVIDHPALAPFYSDLNVNQGGEIYWDFDTVNGKITITFDRVEPYNYSNDNNDDDGAANSFQIVLTDLGDGDIHVEYIYGDIQDAFVGGDHAIAGITDGAGRVYELGGSGNDTFMESNYATYDFGGGDPAGTFSFRTLNGTPDVFAVDGTSGNDQMQLGFIDLDGDLITTGNDIIYGGDGDDSIDGNAGNDFLDGGTGHDTLNAGSGNDSVAGGSGNDSLFGDDGNDTLLGGEGSDLVNGQFGDDSIEGGAGFDNLYGNAGNDTIRGGSGTDYIFGGTGVDSLDGGDDADTFFVENSFGNDTVVGGEGGIDSDTVDLSPSTGPVTVTYSGDEAGAVTNGADTISFSQIERMILTNSNDTLNGGADSVGIWADGRAGEDSISAGSGDDTIFGGSGNDTLIGRDGNDSVDGGDGLDLIYGGSGNDTIDGGNRTDTIHGGTGDDLIIDSGSGSLSDDTIYGEAGNDTIAGGLREDYLDGGDDADTFLIADSFGADTIIGGEGVTTGVDFDSLDFSALSRGVTVTYSSSEAGAFTDGVDTGTYTQIEALILTDFADSVDGGADSAGFGVDGGAGNDTLTGGLGADTILGGTGADSLDGGSGDDYFDAGDGDDVIRDGDGDDLVYGGLGNDTLRVSSGADTVFGEGGNDSINLDGDDGVGNVLDGGDGEDFLDLSSSESSVGGIVTFTGDDAGTINYNLTTATFTNIEILETTEFADSVDGSLDTDGHAYFLQEGDDTLIGGSGADSVLGEEGADRLEGGGGSDTLYGGAGGDTISGGVGVDVLDGGDDDDTFVLEDGFGNDTIIGGEDVTTGTDFDTVDFTALTGPITVTYSGDEAATFTDGTFAGEFSQVEGLNLTGFGDSVDGTADTAGLAVFGGAGGDTIAGGSGDDYIDGGDGDDFLTTGLGQDTLIGGDGNDTLMNSDGDDSLVGGAGDDSIIATVGNDTLRGGAGDDTLDGGAENDRIDGGAGDDWILTGTGDDYAAGGDDRDTIIVEDGFGSDTIVGGEGGTDYDTIDLTALTVPVTVIYTGDEAGTITDGTNTITFSEIERLILTDQADGVDARASSLGTTIDLGDGDDSAYGSNGDDSILGGDGDDLIDTWGGQDTVDGGTGNDTLYGGSGNDLVIGGVGNDSLQGWTGNDTLFGGDGNDTLQTHEGDELLDGGGDADTFLVEDSFGTVTIIGGEGGTDDDLIDMSGLSGPVTVTYTGDEAGTITDGTNMITFSEIEDIILTEQADTVDGSAKASGLDLDGEGGDDSIIGGTGNDSILGGAGGDTISGGDGDDYIDGGDGDDFLTTGLGQDTLIGGDGNDTLMNSAGDDSLVGGAGDDSIVATLGNDTLEGGDGNDTLEGGEDDDLLTGGDGNDVFVYNPGDGNDTITDFNFGNSGTLDDADSTNNDFIDLSAFYDDIWELHADQADDGILNQSNAIDSNGNAVDYSDNTSMAGDSMTFSGASADGSSFTQENTGVVCFAAGTAIRTHRGCVPVENLRPGDLVTTLGHGASKILWIGCTDVALQPGHVDPRRTPVRIKPGVAEGDRALLVSPQHCLLMVDATGRPVLARARHLAEETRLAAFARGRSGVTYFHVLLERHSVLISQGRPSESFYPGPNALGMMEAPERARLLQMLPALRTAPVETAYGPRALEVLTRSEVRRRVRTDVIAFADPHNLVLSSPTDIRTTA